MINKYNTEECNTIEDFWEYLSPENPLKKKHRQILTPYIFRGQGNAEWQLIPKVFRNNICKKVLERDVTYERQIEAELLIIDEFKTQCDLAGLKINNDSFEFRQQNNYTSVMLKYMRNPTLWPDEKILDIMALAQHHGVPTRLLDWSKRSYVAAYFAASSALMQRDKWTTGMKLAVWALDTTKIDLYKSIQIINLPGSTSTNLAAQQGLFTAVKHLGSTGELFKAKSLEEEFSLPDTPLYQITLPVEQAAKVMIYCELYGVTAATLFPGFDGAAKGVTDWINRNDNMKSNIIK
jgi:hypothetical protein